MSILSYGGVELKIIETEEFKKEAVLDSGNTYLFTRVTIAVNCIYNPAGGATTYRIQNGVPAAAAGQAPALTDNAIRHWLLTPRRLLRFRDEQGNVIVRSPEADRDVDFDNGPVPIECDVTEIIGTKTWRVRYVVSTAINDCESKFGELGEDEPQLLSNRWRMTHAMDESYHQVRFVEGRARFNPAWLTAFPTAVPDDYRRWLVGLTPPRGFKRTNIRVTATEDGHELLYSYEDVEMRHSLKRRGIVDVECQRQCNLAIPDMTMGFIQLAEAGAGMMRPRRGGQVRPSAVPTAQDHPNNPPPRTTNRGIGSMISALDGMVPIRHWNVFVRVWGAPDAGIGRLQEAAYEIMIFQLNEVARLARVGNFQTGTTVFNQGFNADMNEIHGVTEGFVQLEATFYEGIANRTARLTPQRSGATSTALTMQMLRQVMPPISTVHDDIAAFSYEDPVAWASMPKEDNGTRGSVGSRLGVAFAQALQDACSKPRKPASGVRDPRTTSDPQDD